MVDDWDQIRTLLKQIQPEDRGAIRFWLREGSPSEKSFRMTCAKSYQSTLPRQPT